MTNEEMFSAIMGRMDTLDNGIARLAGRMDAVENSITQLAGRMDAVENSITQLAGRMDAVENSITRLTERVDTLENSVAQLTERVDTLETNMNMEFWAVRTEMDRMNESLKQDIGALNNKVDRLMFSKDVEGYERMKIRVDVLERGYQDLRASVG